MPTVSVIIPAYNAEKYLEATLHSALRQTYSDFEIILVDDCSKDRTLEIARRFSEEDARIRVIALEKNGGVAQARNIGIRSAEGKYIALLDSDDLWEAEKLEKQLALIEREQVTGVYTSYDFCDASGLPMGKPFFVPPRTSFREMLGQNVVGCSTMLMRSDVMKAHPFSETYYHEDYVLWLELLKEGYTLAGVPDILMHYRRVHGSRADDKRNAAKKRYLIYRKQVKLSVVQSLWYMAQYAWHGVKKYYG